MAPRVEGTDLSRIVAFTDGVFAIAITLLVLALEVPQGDHDLTGRLLDEKEELLAYFLSFAVIGRLWIVHHRFFSALCRFDSRLVTLNLLYLAFVVLIPFTTDLLGEHAEDTVAAVVYAAVLAAASLINFLMIRHALRREHVIEDQREATRPFGEATALFMPGIFLASIPVAFIHPYAAEAMWLLLAVRPRRMRI